MGTIEFGLWYSRCSKGALEGFTDSDWGGSMTDWRSTSGMVFMLGSSAITWGSKKQDIVALSTTKAKYIAATSAACQTIWLKRMLSKCGMKFNEPTRLWCDNQSTISIAKHRTLHERSKQIYIHYHFIRGLITKGAIFLQHCNTKSQLVDILTKPLPADQHSVIRAQMGVCKLQSRECMLGCD